MHEVSDLAAFERQVVAVLDRFVAVDAARIDQWYRGERELPERAVWFTFDDGEHSTVVDAAPVLHRHGVRATVFVCPGLVDDGRAPWWEVVRRAGAAGHAVELGGRRLHGQPAVTALKAVPDQVRREVLAGLVHEVGDHADQPVTVDDLVRWRELGGDIGNHTWDHPCLDRCDPATQVEQIDRATEWLDRNDLWDRRVFAYPNGDRTEVAEQHLADQHFELVALFDHHLAARRRGPLKVSRLRLDAAAPAVRTAAVTSGAHSGLFAAQQRVKDLAGSLRR